MADTTSIFFEHAEQITQNYLSHLFNDTHYSGKDMPSEDWNLMCALLCEILTKATDAAKTKKPWGSPKTHNRQIVHATALSNIDEIGLHMELSLGHEYVHLRIGINYFEELGHMDNQFWNLLAETIERFDLQYEEAEHHYNTDNPRFVRLGKLQKSTLFALMTDYYSAQGDADAAIVGDLTYSLEWNGNWDEVINSLSVLISRCYRLSYPLYRSHHLKRRHNSRRQVSPLRS